MIYQPLILIAGGCSFTVGTVKNWPTHLANLLNIELVNYAKDGSGNGFISRSLIYGIDVALKTHNSADLIVGVMWSHNTRHENYHSDITLYKNQNLQKFIQNDEGHWLFVNRKPSDPYAHCHWQYFYDEIGSVITTLEHILRIQWFLKSKDIRYFMTTFAPGVLPNDEQLKMPSVKYLYDMIDFTKFLPVNSCLEWCDESGIPKLLPDNLHAKHPSREQQEEFTKQVIMPFIYKNIITPNPCKEGEKNELQ